jgi:PKD repeat protein
MNWRRGALVLVLSLLLLSSAAVGAPTADRVRFTAVGDFGANSNTGPVLTGMGASGADLHLALGDLHYSQSASEEAWCDYVKARVGHGVPFELVAGNHESNGQDGHINNFSACLPNQLPGAVGTYGRQYYVDVPQDAPLVRFVMISPSLPFPDGTWNYPAGSARYSWTAAAIDQARSRDIPWVVVGMHKPCLSVGDRTCEIGADITNLLIAKRVDLVLMGHEHNYQRTKQLALGPGCTSLAIGSYNASCVKDSDNDLVAGAGTVFATIGTGGMGQYNLNPGDAEWPYFAATAGSTASPVFGFGDFDVTRDRIQVRFVRTGGAAFSDAFTLTRNAGPPPPNQPPVADFTATTNGLTASFDGTRSADPDGSIASYAWSFGNGQQGSGAAPQHTYAQAGTYNVTLTVTDDSGATAAVTKPVTVSAPSAQVVAADQFERTLTNAWGSADTGGTWSVNTSAGVSSVSGGLGRVVMRTAGTGPLSLLNGVAATNVDLSVEVSLDKLPAGGRVDQAVFLRRTASGDYRAMVRFLANGSVAVDFMRLSGGSTASIGAQVTVPGLTYAAGDVLNVRAQAVGTPTTDLRLKVWKAGTAEPAGWTITRTDSTPALQAPGGVGLSPYLSGSATNAPVQARYDNLRGVLVTP